MQEQGGAQRAQLRKQIREWERRLLADESRRKAEHSGSTDYVASIHAESGFDVLLTSGTTFTVCKAPRGFLFLDTERSQEPSPYSARERASRSKNLDGDSLSGDAVPMPRPKIDQSKPRPRPLPAVLKHPNLLCGVYVAFSLRWLGYVPTQRGKGKRRAEELSMHRAFVRHYYTSGWAKRHLIDATGLSKSTVDRHLLKTRGLLDNLRQSDQVYKKKRPEALCACPRRVRDTESMYTSATQELAGTWIDGDRAERCSHCWRIIPTEDLYRFLPDGEQTRVQGAGLTNQPFASHATYDAATTTYTTGSDIDGDSVQDGRELAA